MKKLLTILSLLAVFTVSGAWAMSAQSNTTNSSTSTVALSDVTTYTINERTVMKYVKLPNGDRCYIVSSINGITCKFKE